MIMSPALRASAALAVSGLIPLEAKLLLGHVLGQDRAWLAAHGDTPLSIEQRRRFEQLVRRRHQGEPIAYLVGWREFYGLVFEVTPNVLIPRPETELLVDFALERIARDAAVRVLDLGTGSGAVAVAVAHARPLARVTAVDVSPAALALARRNAHRHAVANVEWLESDWFSGLAARRFELIVSNPPYVAAGDRHLVEGDLRFEPAAALTAGGDGLTAIRTIVAGAGGHLAEGGWIGIEHGYDQAAAVQALLRDAGFADMATRRDLAGIPRTTVARRG
jgi:release factor glutamine methyltransferase